MKLFKDTLPPDLVTHVTAICGTRGEEWFARLPQTIRELEALWSVEVVRPFTGIEYNFVAEAVGNDGVPVVVKIAPPFDTPEIFGEAKYLRLRKGCGAITLLAEDRNRRAILLERAVPGEALHQRFDSDPTGCIGPAIDVLKRVLQPPPAEMIDVGSLDAWFDKFRRYRETDFPAKYAEKAFELYERLSGQTDRTFYLHGDFHPGNIVTSDRAPFLAIDPKGIVGHLGYDVAVFLNNVQWWRKNDPNLDRLLSYAISEFAASFGFTVREVREWAFVYMVIGAWWTFDEMPEHYDTDFAKLDVWDV